MKRALAAANGIFAAAFLLAPVAIFAAPAGSNNGIIEVDSSAVGSVSEADRPLTSDADHTYVHGFNLIDEAGTYSVVDGTRVVATGAWKGTKSSHGNGFDFTAGPIAVSDGEHTIKVFESSGLSPKEASKTFRAHKNGAPSPAPAKHAAPAAPSSPADSEAGTLKLHPIGPCPDQNAEQLNHGAPNCDAAGFEPADETAQDAEIGKVENVTPRMVPHLPCENIEVLGSGMADGAGTYQVEAHPPTAKFIPVYGKNADGTSVLTGDMTPGDVGHNGTAVYNRALGGLQVMDIIDVDALVHNAQVAGGQEHHIQGYHFKINLTQGAEAGKANGSKSGKQKVFWVDCPDTTQPPVVTPPPPGPQPGPCTSISQSLTGYSFSINGGAAVTDLENNVHQGDTVKVTYTTAGACGTQAFSLVSYTAPSASFSTSNANQQKVYKFDTDTVGAGTHSLTVVVPSCFFQVDFVKGSPIFDLGATANSYYSAQGRLIDAENGGTDSCQAVTAPPPAPILGILKTVNQATAMAPAALSYKIDVTNSGNGAATNVGIVDVLRPGTVEVDTQSIHFFPSSGTVGQSSGDYLWTIPSIAPNTTAELTVTLVARTAGTIANVASIGTPGSSCAAPTCSQVQTVITSPPAPGTITAVIYKEGTSQVVPGGTVQLQGVTTPTGTYPTTYNDLAAASYCVQEASPSGWSLTGATVSGTGALMTSPGQVCFALGSGQVVPVVYYVKHDTPQTPPTACVAEEFMLQGTQVVVPGGTAKVDQGGNTSPQATPVTFCNLPVGSITGTAVTAPAGYTPVSSTSPQTTVLHAGSNPPIIFLVNLPQTQPECGEVLGTIVLAGTHAVVPGGTITEGGRPPVTAYPALLGPCQPTGEVSVSATAPNGYTFVGPSHRSVDVVNGSVTPVVFQVTPLAGGTEGTGNHPGGPGAHPGSGNPPASGVEAAAVQHAPASGVLGTSIGMPLTGSEVALRVGLSLLCLAIGLVTLRFTMRGRRQQ